MAGARKLAARRTIFNLAAPLCNPADPPYQVLGASDAGVASKLIQALAGLGRKRAIVMSGHPGIEDFSTSGATQVHELRDGDATSYTVVPADLGLATFAFDELPAGDAVANAATFRLLAGGGPLPPPLAALRDLVAVNAAAALYCAGAADSLAAATPACVAASEAGALAIQRQRYIDAVG